MKKKCYTRQDTNYRELWERNATNSYARFLPTIACAVFQISFTSFCVAEAPSCVFFIRESATCFFLFLTFPKVVHICVVSIRRRTIGLMSCAANARCIPFKHCCVVSIICEDLIPAIRARHNPGSVTICFHDGVALQTLHMEPMSARRHNLQISAVNTLNTTGFIEHVFGTVILQTNGTCPILLDITIAALPGHSGPRLRLVMLRVVCFNRAHRSDCCGFCSKKL